MTVNGRTLADNCRGASILDERVIRPFDRPLTEHAGFLVLSGNLFEAAIMKTSVIGEEFRARYLSESGRSRGVRRADRRVRRPRGLPRRIDDPALGITPDTMLFMRGTGPIGYPGAAEVVNMRPPAYLITEGVSALPCVGDGRQSGTSGSPSILNACPEAAVMGGLALLRTGDRRADRSQGAHRRRADPRRRAGGAATRTGGAGRLCRIRRRRRRGRRSSARWSASWRAARSSKAARSSSASPRPAACRATTTDRSTDRRQTTSPSRVISPSTIRQTRRGLASCSSGGSAVDGQF